MKSSSATSARATRSAPRHSGQSSGRHQPTLISADEFALAGPSDPPDPQRYAYRKDLADVALAGRVIASHYAEPLARRLEQPAPLRSAPSDGADVICELKADQPFLLLDDTLGWAWGYAGAERRVGYVRSSALAA